MPQRQTVCNGYLCDTKPCCPPEVQRMYLVLKRGLEISIVELKVVTLEL